MSAQGWTPGNRLGARDAAHADFLTAASTSHIKVTIKDDNLGLGARAGRDPLGEPTGLDAFKGLLGRLNGKSDSELKQEQRKRDDVKLARYAAMKFPEVRFVRGGLLTQEKLDAPNESTPLNDQNKAEMNEDDRETREGANSSTSEAREPKPESSKSNTKSKSKLKPPKIRSSDDADSTTSISDSKKKKKKAKKRKLDTHEDVSSEPTTEPRSESSRERRPVGRQVLRGRHIAQKKKALLDDRSLNEVSLPACSYRHNVELQMLTCSRFSWSKLKVILRTYISPYIHQHGV